MRKSAQTVIRPDAYYTIAAANGRVLEVADFNTENGASVRLWSYEGQPWQQWQFVEAGDGEYRIRNRFTGKVMDLAMSGVCNGTWIHQWTQTAGAGQRWQIVEAGGGKVKLRNVLADKVIDLVGMRVENGTQAQIWQDVFVLMSNFWLNSVGPCRLFKDRELQLLMFDKRIQFDKGGGVPFGSSYYCHRLLPKQIVFEELAVCRNTVPAAVPEILYGV